VSFFSIGSKCLAVMPNIVAFVSGRDCIICFSHM